jgi:hypothetical protein
MFPYSRKIKIKSIIIIVIFKENSALSTKVLLVGNEIGTSNDSRRHWCFFVPFLQIFAGIGQDKLEDKLAHGSVGPLRCPQLA